MCLNDFYSTINSSFGIFLVYDRPYYFVGVSMNVPQPYNMIVIKTEKQRKKIFPKLKTTRTTMNKKEYKVLQQAVKILKKEFGKYKCPEYGWHCAQCDLDRMIAGFEDVVEDLGDMF